MKQQLLDNKEVSYEKRNRHRYIIYWINPTALNQQ